MRTARSRGTAGKDNAGVVPISPAIRPYDHILLDLDGCVWVGDEALPGAAEAVTALREAEKSVLFLTNDVRHPPEGFVRKLWRLGFQASLDEVLSVGAAIQFSLASRASGGTAYVVGSQALVDHVADAGLRIVNHTPFASRADLVVVGGHDDFVFEELKVATQAVLRGAELIGATRDAVLPDARRPLARHRRGPRGDRDRLRPARRRRSSASRRRRCTTPPATGSAPGASSAVGDRLEIDVAGARAAGLDQALVLTGGASRAEAEAAEPRPTLIADSLGALVLGA